MLQKLFRRTPAAPPTPERGVQGNNLAEIDKQIKRLAKELYKTNTLAESQTEQTRQAVELMKASLSELQNAQKGNLDAVQAVRVEVVKALFPVIDSVEAGISSGTVLLSTLTDVPPEVSNGLKGWLEGQRLILERLDTILQGEGIQRLQTRGISFDPHYHVAVKSSHDATQPAGIILKEERRGYIRGNSILRYAEVSVNRNAGEVS